MATFFKLRVHCVPILVLLFDIAEVIAYLFCKLCSICIVKRIDENIRSRVILPFAWIDLLKKQISVQTRAQILLMQFKIIKIKGPLYE